MNWNRSNAGRIVGAFTPCIILTGTADYRLPFSAEESIPSRDDDRISQLIGYPT